MENPAYSEMPLARQPLQPAPARMNSPAAAPMSALTPPTSPFVLIRDDLSGRGVVFERPGEIISADSPETFPAALAAAEAARKKGKWLAGYFSYEAGYLLEPKLVPLLPGGRRVPLVCLGVFDAPSDAPMPSAEPMPTNGPIFDARAAWSFEDYRQRFERLHNHLRAGDCYQGNLTFPIRARWTGEPLAAFNALTARQPVRYASLVDLGGPIILSRSPELFFAIDEDGWIETHPMKGTAPRGATKAQDRRLREGLRNDPKNQAENRMIVDLLRNDISLISEVGTLDVPELFRIETYPTVHQMVSRVRAKLLPDRTIRDVFCGAVSMRLHHRSAEDPRDGNPPRVGGHAARRLLRGDRLDRSGRPHALFGGDPHHNALFGRQGSLQCRWWHRIRFHR